MVQFLSESAELAACVSLSPVCVFMGTDTLAIPSYPGWSVKAPFGSFPAGVESSLLVAPCQICSVSSFCPQAPSRGWGWGTIGAVYWLSCSEVSQNSFDGAVVDGAHQIVNFRVTVARQSLPLSESRTAVYLYRDL